MAVVHLSAAHGFVWSGLGFPEWLGAVTAQVLVGVLIASVLIPAAWRLVKRIPYVANWLSPFTSGGPGEVRGPDGRKAKVILATAEANRPRR